MISLRGRPREGSSKSFQGVDVQEENKETKSERGNGSGMMIDYRLTQTDNAKVDTKFLINVLLRGKVIQRTDIRSILRAIFEVSLMKHHSRSLPYSKSANTIENSSSNGGGGFAGGIESSQISRGDDKVLILTSQQSQLSS